jgi:hypothetical protein
MKDKQAGEPRVSQPKMRQQVTKKQKQWQDQLTRLTEFNYRIAEAVIAVE